MPVRNRHRRGHGSRCRHTHRNPLLTQPPILNAAPALRAAAETVRSSHERFDGAGYPDGIAGEDIPLSSRIIFICDAFHAMTSDRPYSTPRTVADALTEVATCSGTQFDPDVAAALHAEIAAGHAYHALD